LRREQSRLDAAGLQVVLVGMGTSDNARAFRTGVRLPFPVLSNPDQTAYRRYGLLKTDRQHRLGIRGAWKLLVAIAHHGGAISWNQDMAQLGGVFVIGRDGIVRFAHRALVMSDNPPIDALLHAAVTQDSPP
jgi:peroxiredoxin